VFARLACVLFLCAAYLAGASGDWRSRAVSLPECELQNGAQDGQDRALGYEVPCATADTILPRERENDPFLALLTQRSSATPQPPHPFAVREVRPCVSHRVCVPGGLPVVRPPHLGLIAKSRQLLC